MGAGNLQFCFYYKGEVECPYKPNSPDYDNDAGFAWMSESICCKIDDMDVDRFLDLICAHMGKWDPYEAVPLCARYIAEYPYADLNMKEEIARTYGVKL